MKLHLLRAAVTAMGIALAFAPAMKTVNAQPDRALDIAPSGYAYATGIDGTVACVPAEEADCAPN